MHSSPTFKGHYYVGSNETHHHFVEKWKFGKDRKFKVSRELVILYKEFPLEFGEIELWPFNPEKADVVEIGYFRSKYLYQLGSRKLYQLKQLHKKVDK